MSNISAIISGHKNLLNLTVTQHGCSCGIREDCPLQKQYLAPNLIYRADAHCNGNKDYKFYFRVAQIPFKESKRDFNHKQYVKSTELSKYI